MGRPRKRLGRKTILTPQLQTELLGMLSTGAYIEHACQAASISVANYYNWMNWGEDYAQALETDEKPNPKHRVYFEFFEAVMRVRSRVATRVSGLVLKAAERDWKAGAWWLERSFPEAWGRQRVEVSGPDGEPIDVRGSTSNVVIMLPHNGRDEPLEGAATVAGLEVES